MSHTPHACVHAHACSDDKELRDRERFEEDNYMRLMESKDIKKKRKRLEKVTDGF